MKVPGSDAELLAEYTATFEQLDVLAGFAVVPGLWVRTDADGWEYWQPRQVTTPQSALEALYRGLVPPQANRGRD
jgi:hypothetical protein